MAVSEPLKSFDCDKESFIGLYCNDDRPAAMLARHQGRFGDAIAALQVSVNLQPGEAKTVVFTLGAAENGREDAHDLIGRYTSVEGCEQAFPPSKGVSRLLRGFRSSGHALLMLSR